MHRIVRRALLPLALGAAMLVAPVAANAATLQQGHWKLDAPGGASQSFAAQVQQPINPNGSSVWPAKRGVIPVQLKVTETDKSGFRFESVYSDAATDNDYSNVVWTPPANTTVSELNSLVANYSWLEGSYHHGGSLRWTINVQTINGPRNIDVYYGLSPQFGSDGAVGGPGSGDNLLAQTDLRFETTSLGGPYYNDYQGMVTLAGPLHVNWVGLIVDSGWGGDQKLNLASASVNGDTFNFPAPVDSSFQTNAPDAKLVVEKYNDGDFVEVLSETLSSAQGDVGGNFRKVDGKYIYNLEASSLGKGDFKVFIQIAGTNVLTSPGVFTLK
jgi:hypothetical protein